MLELILKLEQIRESLREKLLPKVSSNDYHLISSVIALILSSGTLVTGFTVTTVSAPGFAFSLVVFMVGILAILSIVLWPIGVILL